MVGYILLIAITVVSWGVFIVGARNDDGLAIGLGLTLAIASTVMSIDSTRFILDKNDKTVEFIADRNFHQEIISGLQDGVSFETINRLVSEAENINAEIERNRKYADNFWIGIWYSKEVAELELIEIPQLTYSNFKGTNK